MCGTVNDEQKAVLKKWREEIHRGKHSRPTVQSAIENHIFNERTRRMLQRRLFDGIHFEPLAAEFELSVRHTKSIIYAAEAILMEHLP